MVEHRVIGGEIELADHAHGVMPGLDARELDALVGVEQLAAGQLGEKVEMPPGAAEFAVGRELQADRGLLVHDLLDLDVLDLAQLVGGNLALLQPGARLLDALAAATGCRPRRRGTGLLFFAWSSLPRSILSMSFRALPAPPETPRKRSSTAGSAFSAALAASWTIAPRSNITTRSASPRIFCAFCSTMMRADAAGAGDGAERPQQFLDDDRRQPLGRLVQQQHLRVERQRAADRQHLLLAAGELVAEIVAALLQPRKHLVDPARPSTVRAAPPRSCSLPPSASGRCCAPAAPSRCRRARAGPAASR